ncbi:MAG: inositol monophosphatase family protein, partial [Candidatus Saccharibacteria bacterium]|nr:inositol monophosphatase family protein [Candidatus Saccharibacteria bacterium]
FTAMAALVVAGFTQACIIYNYSTDDMFTAKKDQGAYKNNNKLSLKEKPLPHIAMCKGRHINSLTNILKAKKIVCEIAPNGGGYGFTAITEGKFAARFQLHSRGYIHDYAPGALLVLEAGGCIIPIKDKEYDYKCKSFVACHPELEDMVRENISAICELEI